MPTYIKSVAVFICIFFVQCAPLRKALSISESTPYEGKKYFLTVLAMFKNERTAMAEWIEHHQRQGVDRFILVDNGSDDGFLEVLQPYIDQGLVELIKDTRKAIQVRIYNQYFVEHIRGRSHWVMVIDFDEFVYARHGYQTLADFLQTEGKDHTQITIPWKMFGSNNHEKQPKSIIQGFTRRGEAKGSVLGKSVMQTALVEKLFVHASKVHGTTVDPLGQDIAAQGIVAGMAPVNEDILKISPLHINHYPLQSREWYGEVKLKRGDVFYQNNPRKWDDFTEQNKLYNAVEDRELADGYVE